MARKRKRRTQNEAYPGWVWMLFGLAVGLSVALALYVRDPAPVVATASAARAPAASKPPLAAAPAPDSSARTPEKDGPARRFQFYDMLPNFEVVIPEQEADTTPDRQQSAIVEPGVYVLQAGSFSRYEDADRRRALLALQGIESTIQRVAIDERTYHRVRIGPIRDLDELNLLRSRLRQADIDVLRIRLGDQ